MRCRCAPGRPRAVWDPARSRCAHRSRRAHRLVAESGTGRDAHARLAHEIAREGETVFQTFDLQETVERGFRPDPAQTVLLRRGISARRRVPSRSVAAARRGTRRLAARVPPARHIARARRTRVVRGRHHPHLRVERFGMDQPADAPTRHRPRLEKLLITNERVFVVGNLQERGRMRRAVIDERAARLRRSGWRCRGSGWLAAETPGPSGASRASARRSHVPSRPAPCAASRGS